MWIWGVCYTFFQSVVFLGIEMEDYASTLKILRHNGYTEVGDDWDSNRDAHV